MQSDQERVRLSSSFDAVAEDYATMRPHYPAALFDDLATLTTPPPAAAVEIGCGPGTATGDLLDRGWRVVAVEPGPRMAEVARRTLAGRDLDVEVSTFEAWDPRGRRFDLGFSATAFHWVDPSVRWTKTAAVLSPGGHLALVTHRTVAASSFEEIERGADELQRGLGAHVGHGGSPPETALEAELRAASDDIGMVWASPTPRAAPSRPARSLTRRPSAPTPSSRTTQLGRRSPCCRRTPPIWPSPRACARLFADLKEMIEDRFGGSVTRRYLSVLAVARRSDEG